MGIFRDIAVIETSKRPVSVPLSNMKRLFRLHVAVELSETALGHSKLSDLFQDHRFKDVCEVQLLKQGYVVVEKVVNRCWSAGLRTPTAAISISDSLNTSL